MFGWDTLKKIQNMLPFVAAMTHKVYGMLALISQGDEGSASDTS